LFLGREIHASKCPKTGDKEVVLTVLQHAS
jgi:hypothetical protein